MWERWRGMRWVVGVERSSLVASLGNPQGIYHSKIPETVLPQPPTFPCSLQPTLSAVPQSPPRSSRLFPLTPPATFPLCWTPTFVPRPAT